ncbi:MAG: hypothetical protein K2Y56_22650 [Methylobacterium sp.]|uniref:hypothetical protein n=1 Tax=Methylobacterium sp. TaxID=409 RepID=UPI0025D860AD|nr:hypothetical protein [Methylobacterium sp.]MBX9934280.1 hypothetical protein [Methylobacterium sp.]
MTPRFCVPLLATALLGGCAPAWAQGADPCGAFDWSIRREQAWFSAAGLPHLPSGATLPVEMPGATLDLSAEAQARLPIGPSREPKPDTRGGVLHVPAPVTPGLYQITLSENAWIDVSQDGTTIRAPLATTMRPGCDGVAKSLRFQLGTQPVLILVSGAGKETIKIAVAQAERDDPLMGGK